MLTLAPVSFLIMLIGFGWAYGQHQESSISAT